MTDVCEAPAQCLASVRCPACRCPACNVLLADAVPQLCLQANKSSPLENKAVDRSSKLLVGASALGTAALTILSFS